MTASYLSDALGNLLAALADLCAGASTAQVSWDEEPGEYRWLLERDDDHLTVRVLWFDTIPEDALPEEQGEERLRGRCRLDALVRAVAAGARAVLDEHGERGYLKRWDQHPFPTALLERLETAN